MNETRVILRNAGKINPVKSKEYAALGGYEGLRKVLAGTPDDIIAEVKESGLRGRGGAGFPSALKLSITKNAVGDVKYIVCNADEGEPGTNKDRVIFESDTQSILEGMAIAGYAVGASTGYIYLRIEYPALHDLVADAIADARANGFLGKNIFGSGFDFDIEVRSGAGAYVCGEETALLESIEGHRGESRCKPPYPGVEGLWGKPTVVTNVETLANITWIALKGAAEFKKYGTEKSTGTKLYTLCGNVKNPGVYEFPMGVNLKELFEKVGGGCPGGKKLLAVQTGGASAPIIRADQMDISLDIESAGAAGAALGSGAMMFIDNSNDIIDVVENLMEFFVHESCGKCTPCREGNTRLLDLVRKFKDGTATQADIDLIEDLSSTMMIASLCGLGQTSPTPLVTTIKNFRNVYDAAIERGSK